MAPTANDLWVFAYGSLMWQPGFSYREAVPARLSGYRRAFCVYSVHYRGTPERPGLVLGLARGGVCEGLAFRVAAADATLTLRYLRQRELIYGVYREAHVPTELKQPGRGAVTAIAYVAEPNHPSFTGTLAVSRQAAIIKGARGSSGTNLDYLANTVGELQRLDIACGPFKRLLHCSSGLPLSADAASVPRPRAVALCRAWSRQPVRVRPISRAQIRAYSFRANLTA
jgi:glutathione-specific gamma-glutamylcyclotransferase